MRGGSLLRAALATCAYLVPVAFEFDLGVQCSTFFKCAAVGGFAVGPCDQALDWFEENCSARPFEQVLVADAVRSSLVGAAHIEELAVDITEANEVEEL